MTPPALAARQFLASCLLGCVLGCFYGFLRPLRPRHTVLADGLFLLAALWGLTCLDFGICGGDLRLGCGFGVLAGGLVFRWTAGQLLRPVFSRFWKFMGALWRLICCPFKKIFAFSKKLFAYIRYNSRD